MDRSFIDPATFPKEGSYLFFQNINFIHSIQLYQKDLSFEIFENPKLPTEKDNHIIYDQYKLTTKSSFKLSSVNFNEHTQALNRIMSKKEYMKQLRKNVK